MKLLLHDLRFNGDLKSSVRQECRSLREKMITCDMKLLYDEPFFTHCNYLLMGAYETYMVKFCTFFFVLKRILFRYYSCATKILNKPRAKLAKVAAI